MEVPISYRFQCILAYPIQQRCHELIVLMEESSFKDVHVLFPLLVESIFGFRGKPGWGVHQFVQIQRANEFDVLRHFLHPEGPLMRLIDKLMTDSHLKYEFPLSCLPLPVCNSLEGGIIPPFYSKMIQVQNPGKVLPFLSLNPFELFIFHLVYFLIDSSDFRTYVSSGESLYVAIIEDYLHYFLPCDGSFTPAPTYYLKPAKSVSQSHFVTKSSVLNYFGDRLSPLQNLFKKPSEMRPSNQIQKDFGDDDLWRTEVFVQALVDFWLNHYPTEVPRSNFNTTPDKMHVSFTRSLVSPDFTWPPDSSLSSTSHLFTDTFFPTTDHIRLVRMVVKHLHYFSNSARPNSTCHYDEFKRAVVPQILKKKLYTFSKYMFDHWPLDTSFRQVLEMWLSYIQPWRYVYIHAIRSPSREQIEERDQVVLSRWKYFVEENLAFYSVFFRKIIPRLLRTDLSSARNAVMLHRLAKVLSQANLKPLIKAAEEVQTEMLFHSTPLSKLSSQHSMLSKSMTAVGHASTIRQHIVNLESQTYNYVPMFGEEVSAQVLQLLCAIRKTKDTMQALVKAIGPQRPSRIASVLRFLYSMITFGDGDQDISNYEQDGHRAEQYLDLATTQLINLFEFSPQLINTYVKRDFGSRRSWKSSKRAGSTALQDEDEMSDDGSLTPERIFKIMNQEDRPAVTYRGDPDLQPIRSYESALLVRLLHKLSTLINDRYVLDIQHLYERNDFVGQLCRQAIQPPTYCHSFEHQGMPSPIVEKVLPPRICLRALANKQIFGYILAFYGIGWVWGFSFVGVTLTILFCVLAFTICRVAFEPYVKTTEVGTKRSPPSASICQD